MRAEVAILFADLTNSHEFGEVETLEKYCEIIRRFKVLAFKSVEKFKEEHSISDKLYARMTNDNLLAVIRGNSAIIDIMNLALSLRRSWNESELAAELRRFHQSPTFPLTMDLSMGISQGPLVFEVHPFSKQIEPDGPWISRTKRIRRLAEIYAPDSLTLVTGPIKEAATNNNLNLIFGNPMNLDRGEKEVLVFDPNSDLIVLYPVISFPEFDTTPT